MEKLKYPGSLHNHTEMSNWRLRDCIIKLDDLADYAVQLGHKVLAITDHESIGNWVKIEKIKNKYPSLKIIRGNEIYLCRNGLNAQNFNRDFDRYYHFILLAKDEIGARQIREISTKAWLRSYMSRRMRRVPTYYQDLFDIIGKEPGHVIGSTACLGGALATQLLRYKKNQSKELLGKIYIWINQMRQLFGEENFFFEMQPSATEEQTYVNKKILELSKELGIPFIITTDSHYLKEKDRTIHKAYLNAQDGDREVDSFYMTTFMMSTEDVEKRIDLTEEEFQEAYRNIERIGEMCEEYSILKPLRIPELPWKSFKPNLDEVQKADFLEAVPWAKTFLNSDFEGDRLLIDAILEFMGKSDELWNLEALKEIDECLKMTWISSKKNNAYWSSYFLNLQKVIDECWNAGSLVGPGRGSGVGFILLYILGITQINPLREKTKTFRWRFLNPDRVSVLDVDVDIEGGRRAAVLNHLREVYGEDRVANVVTFKTEKSKSAILTAARGLGIDVDVAQYISSLVPADRGQLRTLSQCFYGDEEKGFAPIKQFVIEMTENYPELWEVAKNIEGLICGVGVHAGGVIFVDEPFTESTALMRAPDGTICTQFDLHDCEDCSLIKYDLLSVEAMDKIHNCLDLLCDYNYIEKKETLKETYESVIGIYNLEREDINMWKMVWNHEIQSLFQMEQQSGIQGIALTHPSSVDDLATLNSVIRLMAQEKGAEQPLNKFARFKENINEWYEEMDDYGLTKEEQKLLEPVIKISYGICESQEGFMQLVQMPECGGFDLTWADRLRKSIAKKNPAAYMELQEEYFKQVEEKDLSRNLCNYVWNVLVATSRGYGFNKSHTLAYSLIALQEMNLAFKYPVMFWNCACLISDSGGNEEEDIEENENINEYDETCGNCQFEFIEEFVDENEEEDDEENNNTSTKTKKKNKTTNYGKIAAAIGKIKMTGVEITPPNINESSFTFTPDIENNTIRYGLSGISRIGEDLIKNIIANRPYNSVNDFLSKVKVIKPQMINLIKSGAFDIFGDRFKIMDDYITLISEPKKRLTLQNMKMLIDFNLIPEELEYNQRLFFFNKYLKKFKNDIYYELDENSFNFFEKNYDIDLLKVSDVSPVGFHINQKTWDKIYTNGMDNMRDYLKQNQQELLEKVNNRLKKDIWDKDCLGSISRWEMDSVSFYSHEHELKNMKTYNKEIVDFFKLPNEPVVERVLPIKGKQVPIYRLNRIAGTVLDRNKAKKTVTLLTTSGVVTVKIFGPVFTIYDKQISERDENGKKHVMEKSWFSRGNKIIVTGMKRDEMFLAKKYSRTPYHLVEKIIGLDEDNEPITIGARYGEVEE